MFRFNYHNQFLKAYPDLETMNMAKNLWLKMFAVQKPGVLMAAAERVVKENTFLPTIHDVYAQCDKIGVFGLTDAHSAYIEACRAPSPKKEYQWSHPAVYFAGRASGWHMLANEVEKRAFPVFERNYQILLDRIRKGESIEMEVSKALPEKVETPLDKEEQKKNMAELLRSLK